MSSIKACVAGLTLAAGLFLSPTAFAQEASDSEGNWRFSAYLWTMSLEGDLGIGPIQEEIDLSFSDLLDALEIGGAVVLRYDRGPHMFVTDLQYYNLEPDPVSLPGPLGGVVSTELTLPVLAAYYGHKYDVGGGIAGPAFGVRHMTLDLELELDLREPLPSLRREADPDFTDATFGAFIQQPIGDKWEWVLHADYGIGQSDGTYQAQLLFKRKTKSDNRWIIGARIMGVDFDETLPNGELFSMDTTMAGLTLGFTWDP